jgi:hypothetical protein
MTVLPSFFFEFGKHSEVFLLFDIYNHGENINLCRVGCVFA